MSIQIHIDEDRTAFRPGETIAGEVSWSLPVAPAQISLELFWTTRGKGQVDSEVVQSIQFKHPSASGDERFALKIPNGPFSFSGKLVSLLWGVRLVIHPSQEQAPSSWHIPAPAAEVRPIIHPSQAQAQVTISPTGQEINLVS